MSVLERNHLEIVRAVQQHGTLSAAARQLHVTQSALSHSISKLEAQLGAVIWRREGRGLCPTQAGEYLLAVANRLVPQLAHVEKHLREFANGERGTLRIGMECHPCYQWLLKIVSPYLVAWPHVDLDVKREYQFGGIGALFGYEIDVLVTPDPLFKEGLLFEPVFNYELVLVVGPRHSLRHADHVLPAQLVNEVLITYPVSDDRLDIYTRFLSPAGISPIRHKLIENTDIMLQMVVSGRGVAVLPRWLVDDYAETFTLFPVRLGVTGIAKQLYLGIRETDTDVDYLRAFVALAREYREDRQRSPG